ncbi:MAG: hypothetical protein AAGA66_09835 [Bacteroidota bacterium]
MKNLKLFIPAIIFLIVACEDSTFDDVNGEIQAPESASGSNDFRIGFQLGDGGLGSNAGAKVYTTWAADRQNRWSVYGGDNNKYDPDWIRLELDSRTSESLSNLDFRIHIQLNDDRGNSTPGIIRTTPWASQGGGWSSWATDANAYDFDVIRLKIETRYRAGFVIRNLRIGIQLTDDGTSGAKEGVVRYTPWLSNGGGLTYYAGDNNYYDPDAVRILLDVIR